MRTVLTAVAATTMLVGLSWPAGATQPASASPASSAHPLARLEILGCQVPMPDLPPKHLSELPDVNCR